MTILYQKGPAYWVFEGNLADAKKIPNSIMHRPWNGCLVPNAVTAQERPANYNNLDGRTQWAIDKKLGILDWDGNPES